LIKLYWHRNRAFCVQSNDNRFAGIVAARKNKQHQFVQIHPKLIGHKMHV